MNATSSVLSMSLLALYAESSDSQKLNETKLREIAISSPRPSCKNKFSHSIKIGRTGLLGFVVYQVVINRTGAVTDVVLLESRHESISSDVPDVLRQWKFDWHGDPKFPTRLAYGKLTFYFLDTKQADQCRVAYPIEF